jgi:CDP-diacylglycerol---serine O-phosphatidyltransferase
MRAPLHDLHASNLLTYGSLAAAMITVAASIGSHTAVAACALAIATIADAFDGRFARQFHRSERQARIGRELDSLVDAIAFGLAPVALVSARIGAAGTLAAVLSWAVALFYVTAVVTRLAFYNIQDDDDRFIGIPTPAAALLCCTSLLVPVPAPFAAWPLAVAGVLMIAPLEIPRPGVPGLSLFAAWAVSMAAVFAAQAIG